jgi:protein-S-isoprenylcysteine O-methyltransferase Ste14
VPSRKLQQSLYGVRGACAAQRVTLALLVGCSVALAWWLLFGGGIAAAGAWFGHTMCMASPVRRASMAIALSIYFIRLLFTEFVFLRRGVSWSEAFTIAPWVLFIFVFLSFAAGANAAAPGLAACAGAALFLCGSWMNSYAEYERHVWKQRPHNRGRLYTLSLFRFSRHPNYLGDLISSSGLCLLSGRWMTAVIPVVMLLGFIFVNVPALDAHLHDHYGAEFDEYARRTRKLIPFLY